jgi:hypothetical protein
LRTIKTWWVIGAFLAGVAFAMQAEELILRLRENRVELAAPRVHFLTGGPLKRLQNAAAVQFAFQVQLTAARRDRVLRTTADSFLVSYDVIEETYSVVKLSGARKSVRHLTQPEAEAWCFQELTELDLSGIAPAEPFWVRVDIRSVEERNKSLFGPVSDRGISLNALIELFSGPVKASEVYVPLEAGPLTLEQLRRGRG